MTMFDYARQSGALSGTLQVVKMELKQALRVINRYPDTARAQIEKSIERIEDVLRETDSTGT